MAVDNEIAIRKVVVHGHPSGTKCLQFTGRNDIFESFFDLKSKKGCPREFAFGRGETVRGQNEGRKSY